MRDCHSFDWTHERCEQLTSLWASGLSAKECALELGGELTRSSVIGKVHRLNLPKREQDNRSPVGTRKPRRERTTINGCAAFERAPVRPLPAPLINDHHIPLEQRRTILELEWHHCRFPVGDPDIPGFFFCGAVRSGKGPYCAAHAARAYDHRVLPSVTRIAWRAA